MMLAALPTCTPLWPEEGLRGRFGVYVPPLMEELGLCELEHNAKNNRMRAK
jgi:hypothetical protein